jgi:hypothetical protein
VIITTQRGAEQRDLMTVSTNIEVYGRILEYSNGIEIYVKSM